MTEIRIATTIQAPKEKVWEIFSNFDNYSNWNPLITGISGNPSEGNDIKVKLKVAGLVTPLPVKVWENTANSRFSWGGPRKGFINNILNAEHYFEVREIDDNTCEFVHGEQFLGVIPKLSWPLLKRLKPAYKAMNLALKKEAEAA